ncbi:response regulator [Kineococcus xinjiangensis]|uniref:response regulator n=1 Tax=Kineococcus xinjiangensis TaxID=512762 RepID=UPI000CECA92C
MRVVLAEDSVLLREGLVSLLTAEGVEVVAAVDRAEDVLRAVAEHSPDLAVLDVRMPPTFTDEGIRAALVVREQHPGTAVLVLSQYVEERYATDLVAGRATGVGYLLKDRVADVDQFVRTLHHVAAGGTAVDPEVVAQLLSRVRRDDPLGRLTPRELEVLQLMAEGRSNSAVAAHLFVTDKAVEKHVSSIFAKLDLPPAGEDHRRVLAVLRYLGTAAHGGANPWRNP